MTARPRSAIAAYAIALLALTLLFARAWRIDYDYSIDFQTYWLAGSRILHGQAAELYAAGGGPGEGTPVAMAAGEFKNIPLVAAAFAPLAAWDYATAKRVVWWAGLAAVVATAWCLGRWVLPDSVGGIPARVAIAFAMLATMAPTHIALRHGQTTPFVAALLALYLAAVTRGRLATAGVALGLACLVKFPPLALLGLEAVRGRRRSVIACLATIVLAVAISLAAFGPGPHAAYERGIAEQAGQVMAAHNNQSIAAVATRWLGEARNQDWTPRPLGTAARVASELAAVGLLALVAWGLFPAKRLLAYEATVVLALGIVVLPVAWDHYVLMVAPALVAMAGWLAARDGRSRAPLLAMTVAGYALLALPTPGRWIDADTPSGPATALILSHVFVGLLVVLAVGVAALKTEPTA
jgi:hypothetical protein